MKSSDAPVYRKNNVMINTRVHAGQVISRERLLQDVWRYVGEVETRTVDTHVGRLRKKIEQDVKQPQHIVSVPGFGYRFDPVSQALNRSATAR